MLEKAELTLISMLSKTKKVFTTPPSVLCSVASCKVFYSITLRTVTLSSLFVPPTEGGRNRDFYEKKNLDPKMREETVSQTVDVPDDVDAELLAKVLANLEMKALLASLAKTMK